MIHILDTCMRTIQEVGTTGLSHSDIAAGPVWTRHFLCVPYEVCDLYLLTVTRAGTGALDKCV
jgi:hypothetical protein